MTRRMWKDVAALAMTLLAVITFVAAYNDVGLFFVPDNPRWVTAMIFGLGWATCMLGAPEARADRSNKVFPVLGTLALAFAAAGVLTGSLTWSIFLTIDIAVMWTLATLAHIHTISGTRRQVFR